MPLSGRNEVTTALGEYLVGASHGRGFESPRLHEGGQHSTPADLPLYPAIQRRTVRERREMLIAAGDSPHGRKILYIGLMDENIESLRDDKPILRRLDDVGGEAVPGLEDWTLVVFGPEDTARFIARVGEDKHEGTA
jgi:hypothetical protein